MNAPVKFHYGNGSAVMTEGEDGRYRELLIRRLPGDGRPLVFCMLNPSTADHKADDPTIRRCIGFAMRENANALIVVNLFAYRATNPADLLKVEDPDGPHNDGVLRDVAVKYTRIVCAWGVNAPPRRERDVAELFLRHGAELFCLGTSRNHPRHPLYLRADTPLVPFLPIWHY